MASIFWPETPQNILAAKHHFMLESALAILEKIAFCFSNQLVKQIILHSEKEWPSKIKFYF